jgi:hypothetical protein
MRVTLGLKLDEGIVTKSDRIQKMEEEWRRMQYVLELKEQHPGRNGKRYLIEKGFVTREEYRKYKGKSLQQIGLEEAIGTASIMNDIVG